MLFLTRASKILAKAELTAAGILSVAVTALILLNVITRTLGESLFWVDEAAISAMVWMAFLGASASLHYGTSVSVTLLPDALSTGIAKVLGKLVDIAVLVFACIFLWLTFKWFDPIGLAKADFSFQKFSASTYNFIYSEMTTTLGIPKFWLWLVMPVFAINSTIHSLANVLAGKPVETPVSTLANPD